MTSHLGDADSCFVVWNSSYRELHCINSWPAWTLKGNVLISRYIPDGGSSRVKLPHSEETIIVLVLVLSSIKSRTSFALSVFFFFFEVVSTIVLSRSHRSSTALSFSSTIVLSRSLRSSTALSFVSTIVLSRSPRSSTVLPVRLVSTIVLKMFWPRL